MIYLVSGVENKESPRGKVGKEETDHHVSSLESLHCKASSLVSNRHHDVSSLESLHCKASSLVSNRHHDVSSLESLHCKASSLVSNRHHDVSSLESLHCKASSLVSNITEQGSTLRDLLTTTAGKLRLGSTDAGIAFAPVYSTAAQMGKSGRTMPNILDDIIASVVENKIPASRGAKLSLKLEATTTTTEDRELKTERIERKKQPGTGPNPGN
uniref:Uncharacterized protein n=1 Tax=Hucho hucho TaxID=62062 RepID=A0A4W5LPS3_9TELE